jgi:hypothetical protein
VSDPSKIRDVDDLVVCLDCSTPRSVRVPACDCGSTAVEPLPEPTRLELLREAA